MLYFQATAPCVCKQYFLQQVTVIDRNLQYKDPVSNGGWVKLKWTRVLPAWCAPAAPESSILTFKELPNMIWAHYSGLFHG